MSLAVPSSASIGQNTPKGNFMIQCAPRNGPSLPKVSPRLPAVSDPQQPGRIKDTVEKAILRIRENENEYALEKAAHNKGKEAARSLLETAIELFVDDPVPEHRQFVLNAIDAASKARTRADLRAKARNLVGKHSRCDKKSDMHARELVRLTKQLKALHSTEPHQPDEELSAVSESRRKHQEQELLKNLSKALEDARRFGCPNAQLLRDCEKVENEVKGSIRAQAAVESQLRHLILLDDAGELEDELEHLRTKRHPLGLNAQRLLCDLEEHVSKKARAEQMDKWLNAEIDKAARDNNHYRLQQLSCQARSLNLVIPPWVNKKLNEAALHSRHSVCPDPVKDFSSKRKAVLHLEVDKIEKEIQSQDPVGITLDELNEIRRRVVAVQQQGCLESEACRLEACLHKLEQECIVRLDTETKMNALCHKALLNSEDGTIETGSLRNPDDVKELKSLWNLAMDQNMDLDLSDEAESLLEVCEMQERMQSQAEFNMRRILSRPLRTPADLNLLEESVSAGKRCGISTIHAETSLQKVRADQALREAAEAELLEAAKGSGSSGRQRLQEAVRQAKCAGASAKNIRAAIVRLEKLTSHEEKCKLAVDKCRRALRFVDQEPARVAHVIEAARKLRPWTQELDELVQKGEQMLIRKKTTLKPVKKAKDDMRCLLQNLREAQQLSQTISAEQLKRLSQLIQTVETAGNFQRVPVGQSVDSRRKLDLRCLTESELIAEARDFLCWCHREKCQRGAALKRLQLAMKARNHVEIEISMRQLGALRQMFGDGAHGGPAGKKDCADANTKLMESATAMLRHLGEMDSRRKSVVIALKDKLNEGGIGNENFDGWNTSDAENINDDPGESDEKWFKEMSSLLHEAKQCGVPSSFIDQAKREVWGRRRQLKERNEVCKDFEKALSKPRCSNRQLMMHMNKLKRVGGAPPDFRMNQGI